SRWEQIGDAAAASAAYERILWWAPGDHAAIDRLLKLRGRAGDLGGALLDRAAIELPEGHAERTALLRAQIELSPKEDAPGRLYAWRRLYRATGPERDTIAQLSAAATAAGAHRELEAVLVELAARAEDPAERRAHHNTLAALYEQRLADPL